MKNQTRSTLLYLFASSLILVMFAGYSFLNAAWIAPPAGTPPANNVDAPVNIGSVDQVKDAGLGVNTLAVYGSSTFIGLPNISRPAPMIKFTDTINDDDDNAMDFWTHVNSNSFYILADRTNSGTWGSAPHPMRLSTGVTSANDYAQFSNKVRAKEYCNADGTKCIGIEDILALIPNTCEVEFSYNIGGYTGKLVETINGNAKRLAIGMTTHRTSAEVLPSAAEISTELYGRSYDCGLYDSRNGCKRTTVGFTDADDMAANPTLDYDQVYEDPNDSTWDY